MQDSEKLMQQINLEVIDASAKFWLVRTKGGLFFDEFYNNSFIALGWNFITKEILSSIKSDSDMKVFKEKVSLQYPDTKKPGYPISQSEKFIFEMKEGDIIAIPDKGTNNIAFGKLVRYHEDNSFDCVKEVEILKLIEGGWHETIELQCPYQKRWEVKWIKQLRFASLNPNLFPVFSSRHGLSNIDENANYILSSIYPFYYWNNNISFSFKVKREKAVDALDMSGFIYNSAAIAETLLKDQTLTVKANINSPGDIVFSFANVVMENITQNKLYIALLWISIWGGSFGPISINSLVDHIIKIREHCLDHIDKQSEMKLRELNRQVEMEKLKRQLHELRLHGSNLEIDPSTAQEIITVDSAVQSTQEQ